MTENSRRDIRTLLEIMATLRDPVRGCPWDREQDFGSIAPYTIEEAYEVADAIDRDDLPELRDELGDLLFQVAFHAQMASEIGAFDFGDVVEAIADKMIRRHPHVFGSAETGTTADLHVSWETIKAAERKAGGGGDSSVVAGIGQALPALTRADKLGKRAGQAGFDWPDAGGVADKVREELAEIDAALAEGDAGRIQEEVGDLLLACTSLARHCRVDPEEALRQACRKFESRFRAVEDAVRARGLEMRDVGPQQLDDLWQQAKAKGLPR